VAKIGDDAGVIAIRAALLTVALAACAWFALGVRASHDQNAVSSLIAAHNTLSPAQARSALAELHDGNVLNPDEALNVLRAQVYFHSGNVSRALAIAKGVVSREPSNVDGWVVVELISRQANPALNRLAQARLRQLVPPVT
jgi:predicted Zn-dependent protease